SPSLRGFGKATQHRGVNLWAPVERQQTVLLFLYIRELRVAEPLDRSRLHERLHHLFICVEELIGAGRLRVAERPTLERDAAELADHDRLTAIAVARQVGRLLPGAGVERRVEVRVA